jgi:transcriptional regulator with XRE-family HTH domain
LGHDPSPAPENLADAILAARKAHGWSRREAGRVLGLDEGTLMRMERGISRRPSQETLRKLAALVQRDNVSLSRKRSN